MEKDLELEQEKKEKKMFVNPNGYSYYLDKYRVSVGLGGRGIYKSLEMHTKIQKETKPFYEMTYAFVDEYPEYFDSLPEKIVINRQKETVALLYEVESGGYKVYKSKRQKDDRIDFDVELGFYIAFYKHCMSIFSSEFQKTKINKIYSLRKTKRQILDYFKVYFEDYLLDLDMSANQIKRFQETIKYFDMYEGKNNETITIGGKDIIVEVV